MPAKTQSTYIYRMGTAPNTRSAVSQKNKIYSYTVSPDPTKFQQLGAISEFSHDESRAVDPIRGVGYGDQIAELVPGVTEPMTLTLNKTLLYTLNLFQSVGYKGGIDGLVRSLRHHRWPFDIKQELVFSEIASSAETDAISTGEPLRNATIDFPASKYSPIRALFTYFEGCWFNSYNASYTSDAAIVAETSSVTVSDVISGENDYGEYYDSGLAGISRRFSGVTSPRNFG